MSSVAAKAQKTQTQKRNQEMIKLTGSVSLHKLPHAEAMRLMNVFKILDNENTGYLDKENLVVFFRAMGWVWSDDEMESAILSSLGGGKRQSALIEMKQKWSAVEVLRMADTFYRERFSMNRDKQNVVSTFTSFDDPEKDGLHIMRADLQKIMGHEKISDMNMLLETLEYERKQLGFELDEIGQRMANYLDFPFQPEFDNAVSI